MHKMKLPLILLICLVGVTYPQGYGWSPFFQYYTPRLSFYPGIGQINQAIQSTGLEMNAELGDDEDILDSVSVSDIQARAPFGTLSKPQKKFFVTSLIPSSLFSFNNFRTITISTSTTTVLATFSSTAVVATVQACLPASLFVIQAGLMTMTSVCARRRRDTSEKIAKYVELGTEDSIIPSKVLPMATTSLAPELSNYEFNTHILSSQRQPSEEKELPIEIGIRRQVRALVLTVTTTSTVTSYSFSTTTLKKTVALSGPNALSCLPVGYIVC